MYLSDYCVTIKNELPTTFASLGIGVVECSVLSGFRIGAYNHLMSACYN
jgi:hypothetical protein